jgi:hypothetical protein
MKRAIHGVSTASLAARLALFATSGAVIGGCEGVILLLS